MQQPRPFWFLLDVYGWVVLVMSIITAVVIDAWWIVLLGLIGYLLALLLDLVGGRSLGRTGAMRLAQVEQENRELKAEQARLLGGIRERDERLARLPIEPALIEPAPENPGTAPANQSEK
ncbi:MAG: hypothetical protein WCK35_26515 [Chloroflexota bacterium]